ncbi:MAG: hypothetical protein SFU25_01665 [Candidatus Caenarcaniphilales bacterium]|nr:hypothetical protein [Candidatus Caenarcaniphilales bacterium]
MSEKESKNIVDEVREIRVKHALESFEKDYAYLKQQDPDLFKKLAENLLSDEKENKAA